MASHTAVFGTVLLMIAIAGNRNTCTATPLTNDKGDHDKIACPIKTEGGNSDGATCVFPFRYHNKDVPASGVGVSPVVQKVTGTTKEYYDCTETDSDVGYRAWCSTVRDFNMDGQKWGYCQINTPKTKDAAVPTCIFPFEWKYKEAGKASYEFATTTSGGTTVNTLHNECVCLKSPDNSDYVTGCNGASSTDKMYCAIKKPTGSAADAKAVLDEADSTTYALCETRKVVGDGCDEITTLAPAECKDTMDAGILQNTAGGESMPGAGAVDTCKQTCLSDVNCLAVDHAPNKGCWKHTSQANLDSSTLTQAHQTVTQYRKKKCPTNSYLACADGHYISTANAHALNGNFLAEDPNIAGSKPMTLEYCKKNCTLTQNCTALDFNVKYNQCYHHNNKTMNNIKYVNELDVFYHYKKSDCVENPDVLSTTIFATESGCDSFTEHKNTFSMGGVEYESINTEDECKNKCRLDLECMAIDFNSKHKKCYKHTEFKPQTTRDTVKVTQWRKEDCSVPSTPGPGVCFDTFETGTPNTHSHGGTRLPDHPYTETSCKKACLDQLDCLFVDFNSATGYCYKHVSESESQTMHGVMQFRIIRCSSVTPTTPTQEPTCQFTPHGGVASDGGIQEADGAGSAENCKRACDVQPDCLAVDYERIYKLCFTHKAASYLQSQRSDSTVTQYRKAC